MRLSREAIQRMVTDRVGGGGGAGGGGGISMDDIQGMGFTTQQWVNENFVGIPFWNLLFKIYGKQTTTVDGEVTDEQDITFAPNTMPSRTETTEGGVTTVVETTITRIEALFDFNSVGGVSALGYNPEGGGGGGADLNALLASINTSAIGSVAPGASNVGKCLVWTADGWAWGTTGSSGGGTVTAITAGTGLSGGTITTSGTISISTEYQTRISHGQQAWQWGNHANAGYLTSSDIADMATKSWVETQGFVKSSGVTSVGLSVPTGFTVSGSPVTTSGTLALGIASGYFIPTTAQRSTWNGKQDAISDLATIRSNASHGQTAYGWGNHADQGYLLRTEGMRFTSYGNYIAARFVNADGTYDATRAAKAQGEGHIEWWSDGGYFNHEMGWIRAKGDITIGTGVTDTTHYLQIGGGRLYWDSTNNALYVQKVDSQGNVTAANFYATGGVSALGMGVSGTASLNTLTLGSLSVSGTATVASLTVRNTISSLTVDDLDVSNILNMNGCDISMDCGNINNCGTLGADAIETGTLLVGSGSEVKKIQWDGTYLQVQIGTTTYKFRPDATA